MPVVTGRRRVGRTAAAGTVSVAVLLLTAACGAAGGQAGTAAAGSGPGGVTFRPYDAQLPPTTPCPAPGESGRGAGARLPDVTLPCLGQPTRMAVQALPATPVVLNFWASWCAICRKEMPELQRVADEAGGQVLVLGVNVKDGQRQARALLDDLGVTFPNLYDASGELLNLVPSPGVPTTLVLAPDGTVLDKVIGAVSRARLRSLLSDRLGVRLAGVPAPATG